MNKELHRKHLSIIESIRNRLNAAGFLEVTTPILAPAAIPESHIPLFKTRSREGAVLQLLPSPEYYMKQLIARGWGSIFQFARSFRRYDTKGSAHNPEFTMLEFYWLDHNYMQSMELTEQLLTPLARAFLGMIPRFSRISMAEAFMKYAGLNLADLCADTEPTEARLREACGQLGLSWNTDDTREVLFNRIFLNFIEPELTLFGAENPIFLYDYPRMLRSLSRNKIGTPWTERWELYWHGLELANCFTEETNSAEITRFFQEESEDMHNSAKHYGNEYPTIADNTYTEKISNLPPCSGTALGIDRLLMILTGIKNIDSVICFPLDGG